MGRVDRRPGVDISYFFQTSSNFTATKQATYLKAFAMLQGVAQVHFFAAADATSADAAAPRHHWLGE